MTDLLDLEEVKAYVGVEDDADDAVVQQLIDQAFAAFYAAIGRTGRPYTAGDQLARVEVKDGTGGTQAWLDYPIKALSAAVVIGRVAGSQESLSPADPQVLSWRVGSRRVVRVDGGKFGCFDDPNVVTVTYDAAAELVPDDVKLALFRYVGALYRESGRGEASAERVLDDAAPLPFVADRDPTWQAAVENHLEPRV